MRYLEYEKPNCHSFILSDGCLTEVEAKELLEAFYEIYPALKPSLNEMNEADAL